MIGSGDITMKANLTAARVLFTLCCVVYSTCSFSAANDPVFKPLVDARGFIDVWQLRHDVAEVPARVESDNEDYCHPEGDPEEKPPSAKEAKRRASEENACVEKMRQAFAAYQRIFASFNQAWLPVMMEAIRKGDLVAEIIMRQCETTDVFDRSGIESTCDSDLQRRRIALQRLVKIDFMPAVDTTEEIAAQKWSNLEGYQRRKERLQLATLKKVRAGALLYDRSLVDYSPGNVVKKEIELKLIQRWMLLDAISQDAPRAFTFRNIPLRLNRKPLTPANMTWGQMSYRGDPENGWYWRSSPPFSVLLDNGSGSHEAVAGRGVTDFERARKELLAEIESNINRYLSQDPRWGAFLLHRIGHHEWVPEGMKSTTHLLDRSWNGTWILEKETHDWRKPMKPSTGHAVIKRHGDYMRITVTADKEEEPFLNIENCTLRYSGGLTFLPELVHGGQVAESTIFGYRVGEMWQDGSNKEAVSPLDPKKRYKQVLMQCDKAESADSDRVRFLLLAGEVLVEVGAFNPFRPISVRHYRRLQ